MSGGLIQLVAYGSQDVHLTGNPQITFFKLVYRHHTRFAMESIEQSYSGNANFSNLLQLTIARNGDLVGPITLEVDVGLNLNSMFTDSNEIGDYKTSTKTADHDGWLVCNGRFLDKRRYKKLFAKIGYSFGGSGNNFQLPNFAGKVMAAVGTGTVTETFAASAINTTNDTITVEENTTKWITGMKVTYTTDTITSGGGGDGGIVVDIGGGSDAGGLTNDAEYYVIRINATTIKLAASLGDAVSHIETKNPLNIDLTSQGSGSHTITHTLNERALGEIGGAETHTLTIAELPNHNHGVNNSIGQTGDNNATSVDTHNHGGTTGDAGSHTHTITDTGHSHSFNINSVDDENFSAVTGQNPPADGNTVLNTGTTASATTGITVNSVGNHNHTISNYSHSHTMNSAGGNATHNIIQPTVFGGNVFIYSGIGGPISVCDCWLRDNLVRWGFQLIEYVELEIGGQLIDKQYGEWMDMWTQMTYSQEKYEELLTKINCSIFSQNTSDAYDKVGKMYIPLQFWFCRNPGLFLPMIALQYHDIKLSIKLNCKKDVNMATRNTSNVVDITNFNYDNGTYSKTDFIESILDLRVYCDYVYLDTEERKLFSQGTHEYLIEQVQDNNTFSAQVHKVEIPLKFTNPCKSIVWRSQRTNYTAQDVPSNSTFNDKYFLSNLYDYHAIGGNTDDVNDMNAVNPDTIHHVELELNNKKRFSERDGSYFRVVQPSQHISKFNGSLSRFWNNYRHFGGGFYSYNFGLRVDEHQPSGTINFSRIDQKVLRLFMNPYASGEVDNTNIYDYEHRVWAVNYNILRVQGGMAGLAYAN